MDAPTVLTRLLRTGWEVWTDDGELLVRHATQQLTPAQRQYLTTHKAALLAALDAVLAFEERAAIAEYCGGVDRDKAEQWARACGKSETSPSGGTAGVGNTGTGDDGSPRKSAGLYHSPAGVTRRQYDRTQPRDITRHD